MAQVFLIGTVAADLELRISTRKIPYIRFGLFEQIGHGETGSRQYYQVWAFGPDAEWLAKKNVKKGSLLWISGQLRLVDCLEPNGATGKVLKITFKDGDYVAGTGQRSRSAGGVSAPQSAEMIPTQDGSHCGGHLDGDREPLPE